MKSSELIELLQSIEKKHGDVEVYLPFDYCPQSFESVNMQWKDKGSDQKVRSMHQVTGLVLGR